MMSDLDWRPCKARSSGMLLLHATDHLHYSRGLHAERSSSGRDEILPYLQVNLWGLDAIKTKGESVAVALHLVGARPISEGTGRIARFELIPLEELNGRPRVDVLCNMSGIFRDSFQNVVELLDDLFQRAANADEPEDMNFVRSA